MIIGILRSERLCVLEDFENPGPTYQPSVFWHHSKRSDLDNVWHVEGLSAAVIINVPYLYHAFGITGNEYIQIAGTINAY